MPAAQISAQIEEFSKRIFGSNSPVRIKMIEKMMTAEGQAAFGQYLNGMIEIVEGSKKRHKSTPKMYLNGMIEIVEGSGGEGGTYLHETVHAVMDMFLTPAEKAILFEEARKKYAKEIRAEAREQGISIEEATEEVLAENFIAYAMGRQGVSGKIRILFERLLNAIKGLVGNAGALEHGIVGNESPAGSLSGMKNNKGRNFVVFDDKLIEIKKTYYRRGNGDKNNKRMDELSERGVAENFKKLRFYRLN